MKGEELAKLATQYSDFEFEFTFTDGCNRFPNVRRFENLELCDIGHSDKTVLLSSEEESPAFHSDCIIKHLTGECSYNETGCSDCKGKERIKIALAKSEAKKIIDVTRVKDGDNFVGYIGKCPHCGSVISEDDNMSYCDCGQKVDWSEVY